MRFKLAHAALVACLTTVPALGADDEPLTLGQALARARQVNPELAAFALELKAQDARSRLAQQRPAPQAELLVEDAVGTGDHQGFDAAQTTLSLSQVLELGGKRSARTEAAAARRAVLVTEQAVLQLDVAADIARRFVATAAQQERLSVARDAVGIAEKARAAVEQRVRAAAAPEAERHRANVTVAEARLDLEDATHALDTARHELAAAIGLPQPDFSRVAAVLYTTPESAPLDDLIARLDAGPDLLRYVDEARFRDAELRLAQSQRSGDLRATLGVRRFEQTTDTAFLAGLSLPLRSRSRAAPAVAAAQAQKDQVASRRQAALLKARAHLFAQYQAMEHARHVTTALRDEVLPALNTVLEQTDYAYRRGRYSYLELSDAQRRLVEARIRLIAAATDFQTRRIEIERLTGQSLGASGVEP